MHKILPILLMLAASLTACGGGGGGGSGSPSQPSSGGTGLSVSFSDSSLSFNLVEGQGPVTQTMSASASGSTDKDILMGAEVTGTGLELPIRVDVDRLSRVATIRVTTASGLSPGVYSGTIKMMACTTQDCSQQHAGSPHMVSYTVNVAPNLHPSVSSVQLAAAEAGTSATSLVTVTLPANSTLIAGPSYNGAAAGWLSAQVNGGTVTLQASARGLAPGTYQATLVLLVQGGAQKAQVPVTLTVGSALAVPESAKLQLDSASAPERLSGAIPLALAAGTSANSWTAWSDAPWLKLDRASGDFDLGPSWHIDTAASDALPNNATHVATITVIPNGGLQARVFKLSLQKALAEIKGLDVYALLEGQAGDVMVYGSGFTAVGGNASLVKVNGRTPSAVTALSDGVLRLTIPALAAGTYPINITSPAGLSTPAKSLRVTSRDSFSYQALATTGNKTQILWDPGSKSAFVVDQANAKVLRYAMVNGSLQLAASRDFPGVEALGMSADASYLLLTARQNSHVYRLAPNDLSTIGDLDGSYALPYSTTRSNRVTVLGDNRMMLHNAWLDLDSGKITPFAEISSDWGLAYWGAVSGNGMRMIRPDSGTLSSNYTPTHYDLASKNYGYYKDIQHPFFYDYSVDHTGDNWVLGGDSLVDFAWKEKGQLALPAGWLSNYSAISRNGTRAYRYAVGGDYYSQGRIYVFDTSVAVGAGNKFPVLGHIDLPELASCLYQYGGGGSGCQWAYTPIAITDDDQHLLLAGDVKIMVVPIPATYRARASAPQANRVLTRLPGK